MREVAEALQCCSSPQLFGVQAAGAGDSVAMAIRCLVAPGGQPRSNIEVGLLFGGRSPGTGAAMF